MRSHWVMCVCVCVCVCVMAQVCPILCDPMVTRLLCLWDSPGKNTGVGCRFLFQEILTQGLNPGPLCFRKILYRLSHQGSLGGP